MEILYLFVTLAILYPILRQRILEASRQRLLRKIEAERGSRAIVLIHRQETMSLLGLPVFRYIDINDSEAVLRAIYMTDPDLPLDIVLHTPGGLVLASLQIARAIQAHPGKVTVFVPHHAMSGGTLIALAADEIVMCKHAVLGPVDPILGEYPAASILRVLRDKPMAEIDDKTIILADQATKAMQQVHASVLELLRHRMGEDEAQKLADLLTQGTWTHDYPIPFEAAREMGLPVKDNIPDDVMTLLNLYPQPVPLRPSVEYVPTPHGIPAKRNQS